MTVDVPPTFDDAADELLDPPHPPPHPAQTITDPVLPHPPAQIGRSTSGSGEMTQSVIEAAAEVLEPSFAA